MASLELITNLKLINGTARTTVPTVAELPLGYMCFGIVSSRASIWGNYDGTVHDLVVEGTIHTEIVQVTGTSTTVVMSQNATTEAITNASTAITNKLGTASSKDVGTAAGNVPLLDAQGKLADSVIPAIAITDTFVVATETAMLALTAQIGDVAIRTDVNRSYILQSTPASKITNWKELLTPTDTVLSVNGKTDTVTLYGSDITSNLTQAASRVNLATGESIATSLGKVMTWFADLKGLAFKEKIDANADIEGTVPFTNLPIASDSLPGIASFPIANGFSVNNINGTVDITVGTGIAKVGNALVADVILKIATI